MDNQARIPAPNYTQIPNAIFELMADKDAGLTEKELKVLLAIARKTFGWHKKRDKISLTQLEQMTSMSRSSVVLGIKAAIERGIVRQTPDRDDKKGGVFYELVVDGIDQPNDLTSTNSELVRNSDQFKIHTKTSTNSELELVRNSDTQKKEKEKKERGGDSYPPTPAIYQTPAVVIYVNLTGRTPNRTSAEMIAEQVKDVAKWEREVTRWLASDFKPGNVVGMLDWYHGKGRHQKNNVPDRVAPTVALNGARRDVPPDAQPAQQTAAKMKELLAKARNRDDDATP